MGLFFVVFFILQWGYGAFCEAVFNGRTLGKRIVGIRVVSIDGVPITAGQAVLRNLLWTFEWFLPLGYLPAIASMLLTRRFQRLGDLAANTMVVVESRERQQIYAAIRDPKVNGIMNLLPARVVAGPELSRALGDYVRRRRRNAKERREEMAGHLAAASRFAIRCRRMRRTTRSCARFTIGCFGEIAPMALTIVDRLAEREGAWRELDALLIRLEGGRPSALEPKRETTRGRDESRSIDGKPIRFQRIVADPPTARAETAPSIAKKRTSTGPLIVKTGKLDAGDVLRLGELYRAACADLMIAEAGDMPGETIASLHRLVGRAHNAIYRGRGFHFRTWAAQLLAEVPRRFRKNPTLIVSALAFYGCFLIAGLIAAGRPEFARKVAGDESIDQIESMYSDESFRRGGRADAAMAGFYIQHNAGIGLKCVGMGLTFGVLTLYELVSQGLILGATFGYMATSPNAGNFYTFVTAQRAVRTDGDRLRGRGGPAHRLLDDRHERSKAIDVASRGGRRRPADNRCIGAAFRPRRVSRRFRLGVAAPLRRQRRDRDRLRFALDLLSRTRRSRNAENVRNRGTLMIL